ncbi:hypothetical protein GCM10022244_16390 [Streptomyces gulbargensis]|uniref:Uncharacterized protein n=1 Tax=Streptomyces gulbargensis TaxID=364901 RepID=A0ABP7LT26_9ACTN
MRSGRARSANAVTAGSEPGVCVLFIRNLLGAARIKESPQIKEKRCVGNFETEPNGARARVAG